MGKKIPRISEAEWRVMRVLWDDAPATAREVIERLEPVTDWKPKTVKTLLNRLVAKKALGFKKEGREYHYSPLVKERECIEHESRSFLARVYGGALTPMLVSFLEKAELSQEEIADLKRILEDKEEET